MSFFVYRIVVEQILNTVPVQKGEDSGGIFKLKCIFKYLSQGTVERARRLHDRCTLRHKH